MHTIVSLIAAGIGVSLVPESVCNLRRAGVTYVPLREPAPAAEMAVAYRKGDTSPVLRAFLAVVAAARG